MKWHDEELNLDNKPDDVSVSLIGKADIGDNKAKIDLIVYISHMQETVSVIWKSKTIRLWKPLDTVTTEEIADKFGGWVSKFHNGAEDFLKLVRSCAIKSDPDTMKWLMSKYQSWKS